MTGGERPRELSLAGRARFSGSRCRGPTEDCAEVVEVEPPRAERRHELRAASAESHRQLAREIAVADPALETPQMQPRALAADLSGERIGGRVGQREIGEIVEIGQVGAFDPQMRTKHTAIERLRDEPARLELRGPCPDRELERIRLAGARIRQRTARELEPERPVVQRAGADEPKRPRCRAAPIRPPDACETHATRRIIDAQPAFVHEEVAHDGQLERLASPRCGRASSSPGRKRRVRA